MTLFALTGRKTQGPNDAIRDLILNGENVNDLAIEPLRPKLVTVTGVDQLNIDSETQSRFSDAALKQRLNAQASPNLARVEIQSSKSKA